MFTSVAVVAANGATDFSSYEWTEVNENAGWAPRAGLQAVILRNRLYVIGGRTPNPTQFDPFGSILWDDVWKSRDLGKTWTRVAAGPVANPQDPDTIWPVRGYFQAVTKGNAMFVLGGQDFSVALNPDFPINCPPAPVPCPPFIPNSTLFNDVWRSTDGTNWEELTTNAPWQGRSGLSAIVFKGWIYIIGGGKGDDIAIGGTGRELFNDVWRSRDGRNWELVTPSAGWSPRPGHQCQVLLDAIVYFGGFGFLIGDPCIPVHPSDVWISRDGKNWEQVSDALWNAGSSADVEYDFDSHVVRGGRRGMRLSIFTFGGDREASFAAPDPMLVDNDVWRFSPPNRGRWK
jgi:hypothetical protein